jgi:uncharacterized phage protein (TIGR01671 family)
MGGSIMREIKFRAWDKEYKKMMEWGKQLKGLSQNGIKTVMSYNSEDGWSDCYNLKDIELMQYTGLKDKNGKEIYEGDIVKYFDNKEHIVVVENIKELGTGMYLKRVGSGYYTLNPSVIRDYEVEVIGNIYENPELLEVV